MYKSMSSIDRPAHHPIKTMYMHESFLIKCALLFHLRNDLKHKHHNHVLWLLLNHLHNSTQHNQEYEAVNLSLHFQLVKH